MSPRNKVQVFNHKRISTFLCHFSCHGGPWLGLVVFPQVQLGNQSTREVMRSADTTLPNPILVLNGRKVYCRLDV